MPSPHPSKSLGWLSLVTLVSVTLWLVLLIWDTAAAGPLETFEQVFAHIQHRDWKFTATYLNAGIFTVCVVALMAGLYPGVKSIYPVWGLVGLVFVPIYGVCNLFAYLSQITLVPILLETALDSAYQDTAYLLLHLSLQLLPGSVIGFFNGLAYALLGIPSIIFGRALISRASKASRAAGWLLMLNGIACILGLFGYIINSPQLSLGVVIGGGLFWLALFPLTFALFKESDDGKH